MFGSIEIIFVQHHHPLQNPYIISTTTAPPKPTIPKTHSVHPIPTILSAPFPFPVVWPTVVPDPELPFTALEFPPLPAAEEVAYADGVLAVDDEAWRGCKRGGIS